MARMVYEPITQITDELLAMRWQSEPAARMWFTRRDAAPGRLGLRIVQDDDGMWRVELKPGLRQPRQEPAPADFEAWAIEVDQLLLDANEPAETDANLAALFHQGLTAANAAQRIINRRAADLEVATAPAPKLAPASPPAVVSDTLADKAAAPHADSKPQQAGNEVVLSLITTETMAPIVARRLSQITGASVAWAGNRVSAPSESDSSAGRR